MTNASGLPMHHLSIRVPWHDNGWNGTICSDPVANSSCLRLLNIHRKRDDALETSLAGRSLDEPDVVQPPCVAERATFMAPFAVTRQVEHPYHATSEAHTHYLPTEFTLPAFTAGCVPFRWMLRENARDIAEALDVIYHDQAEDEAREIMDFDSSWVQHVDNQRRMLDAFFSAIDPGSSLAFFYAKEVPFAEDPRRVLVGVGRVTSVGDAVEYRYSEDGPTRSLIWERAVGHSVRAGFADGFLLPYREAVERAAVDPSFDPASIAVFAPDATFDQYSYGSEHLTHDQAIGSLLNLVDGLERAEELLGLSLQGPLRWAGERLGELWRLRGPFPGLGAALHAFGVDHANLLAHRIAARLADNENPWPVVEQVLADPSTLGPEWVPRLGTMAAREAQRASRRSARAPRACRPIRSDERPGDAFLRARGACRFRCRVRRRRAARESVSPLRGRSECPRSDRGAGDRPRCVPGTGDVGGSPDPLSFGDDGSG